MINSEHVVRAIASHAKWKYYLRQAIRTGRSEWTVPAVRVDDQCAFGQWLRDLPEGDRLGDHWASVRTHHAEFHRAAAEVLHLALAGHEDEAEAAMSPGSRFAEASKHLTLAMMAWKKEVEQRVHA